MVHDLEDALPRARVRDDLATDVCTSIAPGLKPPREKGQDPVPQATTQQAGSVNGRISPIS